MPHDNTQDPLRFIEVDQTLRPDERAAIAAFDALSEAQQRAYLLGDADGAGRRVLGKMTTLLNGQLDELAAAWHGRPRVQTVGGQPLGYRTRARQAQLFFAKFMSKGGQRRFYRRAGYGSRAQWLAAAPEHRLRVVAKYSAVPGVSRHHWGTDVDLSPVEVRPWLYGRNRDLREFLEIHGAEHSLTQAYSDGRLYGYEYEPWHLSHTRLAPALHRRFEALINLDEHLVPKTLASFDAWAQGRISRRERAAGHRALAKALSRVDLWSYINGVDQRLVAWQGEPSVV